MKASLPLKKLLTMELIDIITGFFYIFVHKATKQFEFCRLWDIFFPPVDTHCCWVSPHVIKLCHFKELRWNSFHCCHFFKTSCCKCFRTMTTTTTKTICRGQTQLRVNWKPILICFAASSVLWVCNFTIGNIKRFHEWKLFATYFSLARKEKNTTDVYCLILQCNSSAVTVRHDLGFCAELIRYSALDVGTVFWFGPIEWHIQCHFFNHSTVTSLIGCLKSAPF